jgi:hypothetical protein
MVIKAKYRVVPIPSHPTRYTITKLPGIVKVMHENVDTNLGIVQASSLGRALVGRG